MSIHRMKVIFTSTSLISYSLTLSSSLCINVTAIFLSMVYLVLINERDLLFSFC